MRKSFLICSLQGRLSSLIRLLSSLKDYTDWNIYLSLQQYSNTEIAIVEEHCERLFNGRFYIFKSQEMTGPHLARCRIFDEADSDIWCILDDDMYGIEGLTDYNSMADILASRHDIGLLSSNWRKSEKMLAKVDVQDKLLKQVIVYTGGGMMLRRDVVEIIKAIPRVQYLFDNPLWSIYSYVNGYENYRYMGSVAIHEICTKGGRRKWISENDKRKSLPPVEWIRTRKGKGQTGGFDEYLICDSTDVTDLAKRLHKERLKNV